MKKTCKECPFRKDSIKGRLGGFTLEETLNAANSESDFVCHLTRETEDEEHCVGRLLRATKIAKVFKRWDLEGLRVMQKDSDELDNILGFDFKEHHTDLLSVDFKTEQDFIDYTIKLYCNLIETQYPDLSQQSYLYKQISSSIECLNKHYYFLNSTTGHFYNLKDYFIQTKGSNDRLQFINDLNHSKDAYLFILHTCYINIY